MRTVFTYRLNRKVVGYISTYDNDVYYAYSGKKSGIHKLIYTGGLKDTTDKIDKYFINRYGLDSFYITIS